MSSSVRWYVRAVQLHQPRLRAYLHCSFRSLRDVDDIVQDAYLRLWKAGREHRIVSTKAFLFCVARRRALDALRKHQGSPIAEANVATVARVLDPIPNGADLAEIAERMVELRTAIAALPPRCREVFALHKLQGVPQREIASRLGLSPRSVEKYCQRAMRQCAAWIRASSAAAGGESRPVAQRVDQPLTARGTHPRHRPRH
jgi:RNA polymerase sigma-70 factor (ECF subfamily)